MREGDEVSEKEFRNRLVEYFEKEGIFSLNLGQGTFDIYVLDWKKFIELKEMVDLCSFNYFHSCLGDAGHICLFRDKKDLR